MRGLGGGGVGRGGQGGGSAVGFGLKIQRGGRGRGVSTGNLGARGPFYREKRPLFDEKAFFGDYGSFGRDGYPLKLNHPFLGSPHRGIALAAMLPSRPTLQWISVAGLLLQQGDLWRSLHHTHTHRTIAMKSHDLECLTHCRPSCCTLAHAACWRHALGCGGALVQGCQ